MRVAFVVNDASDLAPKQTTTLLIHRAATREHETFVFGVTDLCVDSGPRAYARRLPPQANVEAVADALATALPGPIDLTSVDLIVLRTNPGRDKARAWAHDAVFDVLLMLKRQGVVVVNDPLGARLCGSKLFLTELPQDVRPQTLVSCNERNLTGFVQSRSGATVLKPARGTWGTDIYRLSSGDSNLAPIARSLSRDGYVIAQEFLPAVHEGDVRLLMLDGEPLIHQGCLAAVRRVPPDGDFRSNVSLGGTPRVVPSLTPELDRVARAVGPWLVEHGVSFAGLDVVGSHVLELHAWSPGGLPDAISFQGVDFAAAVLEAFERRAEAGGRSREQPGS